MTKALLTLEDNKKYRSLGAYGGQSEEGKNLYVGLFSPDHATYDRVYGNSLEDIFKRLYKDGYDPRKIEIEIVDMTREKITGKKENLKKLIEKIK